MYNILAVIGVLRNPIRGGLANTSHLGVFVRPR